MSAASDRATARAWRKRAAGLREESARLAGIGKHGLAIECDVRAKGYDRDAARLEERARVVKGR